MQKKRVAIIGTTGLPAKYGGFETLAHHLVDRLNQRFDLTVFCSSKYFSKKGVRRTHYNGAKLQYLPFNANGYQSIIYDVVSIFKALKNNDVLLLLGVSGAICLPFIKMFSNIPVIVNIDGQEWKRQKWNWIAKKFLGFSERLAVRYADHVVADNKVIYDYVVNCYGQNDASLIEYGSDHVQKVPLNNTAIEKYPFLNESYAFNVCRIEPENNVHLFLDAYAHRPKETLVIVGLWSHNEYGRMLKEYFSEFSNLHLLDPIYEQEDLDIIRSNAALYLHGHSAGGTNPSLVEAMALGLPILAYDVSYNRETTENKARYFDSTLALHMQLDRLTAEDCVEMRKSLEGIASKRYTWGRITDLYAQLFGENQNTTIKNLTSETALRIEEVIEIKTLERKEAAA
jgi:glycosyltransferase involved in cell wall biosynthesis